MPSHIFSASCIFATRDPPRVCNAVIFVSSSHFPLLRDKCINGINYEVSPVARLLPFHPLLLLFGQGFFVRPNISFTRRRFLFRPVAVVVSIVSFLLRHCSFGVFLEVRFPLSSRDGGRKWRYWTGMIVAHRTSRRGCTFRSGQGVC